PNNPATTSLTVSPASANIRAGSTFQFTANTSVRWSVNGTAGGSASLGVIDSSGNYTAPSTLPNPNVVTITATSTSDSSQSSSASVTLMNPAPTLIGTNPAAVGTGNFTLAVSGAKFVLGAQVFMGTTALATTFVSTTQLTASG